MALRSDDRKLSFEVLSQSMSFEEDESLFFYRSNSDPIQNGVVVQSKPNPNRKKRKHRRKKPIHSESSIREDPIAEATLDPETSRTNGLESNCTHSYSVESSSVCTVVTEPDFQNVRGEGFNLGELRQRSVSISGASDDAASRVGGDNEKVKEKEREKEEEESGVEVSSAVKQRAEPNGSVGSKKLETEKSLDWKRLMADDPNLSFTVDKSPLKYFMEEMYNGNALRNTTTIGNEVERERVYDTIFRLPWRCELLIDVGFFVCLDSFLSLLTIMPTRIVMTLWRLLRTRWLIYASCQLSYGTLARGLLAHKQFKMWSAAELSDFGCFLIIACGVTLLQRTDISLIYHMIRGQGTIKLYVVYNVLEIFDRLCQNFNGDVLQTLFNSTEGLASSPPENRRLWVWRFIFDEALAMGASIVHSFILLAQAITLSTVIVAHNNALLALLVSNNFAEIKSNVFKRFSKDNIHGLVYFDSVERFHISAFMLFVLAQNILEAEGPWFESFVSNALMVFICEMAIDIIKHSFIAKFNDIKPTVYSEFLEDLCKQTLNTQTESAKKNLTFVPLAPACVVIRVLTPVYAAHLPYNPLPWRLFWILFLCAMTYVMLTSLKVMIGMGLQKHATWYVNRCRKRKHHLHYD
ncbi:protein POLLEN DEFECTIVE IN GUIDANCE 1 isoform X1 [Quercus lobata]|uniref:protein POLLEN DEFECTIVE IN GUIDANCE 1 isoform X1 n=1 Tax=Quercus lobata TaxID=97700 RepID=UPI001243A99A|nr:protein POLLEN DEFECTIVE IN GUIDANCE 1 isoform X1 [Quercus lobata]